MLKLSKIKIIILIAFILANIVFATIYIFTHDKNVEIKAGVLAECGGVLEAKNIKISAEVFPNLPEVLPLYTAINAIGAKDEIARHMLGSASYMLEPNYFQTPEFNLFLNGGKFDLYPIDMTDEILATFGHPYSWVAKSKAKHELKVRDLWTKRTKITAVRADTKTGIPIVEAHDMLGKYAVLDSFVQVWVATNEAQDTNNKYLQTHISGRNWLNTAYAEIPQSLCNIQRLDRLLVAFAEGQSASETVISAIDFGYFLGERAPEIREVQARPCVKLVMEGNVVYIDAITGKGLGNTRY